MTAAELAARLTFFNQALEVVVQVGDRYVPITAVNLNDRAKPTRLEIQHDTKTGET